MRAVGISALQKNYAAELDRVLRPPKRPRYTALDIYAGLPALTSSGITNRVPLGTVLFGGPVSYMVNMYQDNHLPVLRSGSTLRVLENEHFGHDYYLYVDGERKDRDVQNGEAEIIPTTPCSGTKCLVHLSRASGVDVHAVNVWGGVASAENVTAVQFSRGGPTVLEENPERAVWLGLGIAGLFAAVVVVRKWLAAAGFAGMDEAPKGGARQQ